MSSKIIFLIISLNLACGKNAFVEVEDKDEGENAAKYLEKDNPTKAISILLAAIGTNYSNAYYAAPNLASNLDSSALLREAYLEEVAEGKKNLSELTSILASAHAQLYGIDPLSLALALATSETSTSSSKNELTRLFPYLPEATTDNIAGLSLASAILDSMGGENFTAADFYKKGLFLTASASLLIKKYDNNGDGNLSEDELIDLSLDDALSFLTILASAALSASSAGESDGSQSANSTKKITSIQNSIDSQEGSTQTDKVKNYLLNKK